MSIVSLAHKTEHRARFKFALLDEKTDKSLLLEYLVEKCGIENIKIKSSSKSIIFTQEKIDIAKIRKVLDSLEASEFEKKFSIKYTNQCYFDNEYKPSKNEIYKSLIALGIEPVLSNDIAKMSLTSYASYPLLKEGLTELLNEGLTSKVLEATAVGVSIARRDYLAANGTNAMLNIGEYIEETTVYKSDNLIKELAQPNVKESWVEVQENGKKILKLLDTKKINKGDIVVVGAGETISVDGRIIEGEASINQVSMTGESEPVDCSRGDRVMSGTTILDGKIKIWAESVGDDTAVSKIKEYITSSLNEKSKIGLKATKLADKLVPVTLSLAVISYAIKRDFESVASVLQADYSCALKLATPVAFKNSIAQAGKNGIIIKGAKSLESLSEADIFVFDKTGTLTYGDLEVESINSFDENWSKDDILNLAASAEEHYFHPVAHAVVEAAKRKGFDHMHHEEVEFIVAHGVKTQVNNKEVVIGSRHFLEDDEGIDFTKHKKKIQKCLLDGKTILYIGYDGKLLGTIGMRDKVRENAKDVIAKLKDLNVKKIVMLTGDIELKAKKLADELGIDEVYCELEPTDKSKIVNKLKQEGYKVAFVGDGINDAPALINADVGISMSKGADIAKATADVVLLKDNIEAVVELRSLSISTLKRVDQNFNATVGINTLILLGATLGLFSPLATAILHNGTTIGLLANSMSRIKI